jgi:hypothetical protein
LILVFRKNLPTGKTLGSSFIVTVPVPIFGLSLSIVANLYSLNEYPSLPIRSCKKNISPSPENLKIKTTGASKGNKTSNASPEKKISKKRSRITSFDLSTYQFLYEQNLAEH